VVHEKVREEQVRIAFITANFVARECGYKLDPFVWASADRATVEAFHGPRFGQKFDELCALVSGAGFEDVDLWVAHLNPFVATRSMVDEAVAILRSHRLRVVAYTGGLGRPENITRAEAEKVYQTARAIGAPLLGVGLHPSNARLAHDLGRAYGIKYAIENHPERTPAELLARIGDYGEWIGVTQDTGFWPRFGYDPVGATRELKDHLLHVHLKQVREVGGVWHSCAYDEGVIDMPSVVEALKEIDYRGALSVEHEPHHEDPTPAVVRSAQQLRGWLRRA
jgi:sugar phosphate isomerase/epimerase